MSDAAYKLVNRDRPNPCMGGEPSEYDWCSIYKPGASGMNSEFAGTLQDCHKFLSRHLGPNYRHTHDGLYVGQ